jgi:tellurium resistance protein TerD
MAINLSKGEKINFSKDNPGLQKIRIGLSWDAKPGITADLDASIFLLGDDEKLIGDDGIVFYNNQDSFDGAVHHNGDNRDGSADGDDETIVIDLNKVGQKVKSLLVVLTSYADEGKEKINFGRVKNATARLYDEMSGKVLNEFDLSEDMSDATSMEMVKIYRHNGEWKLGAIGEKVGSSINGLSDVYNKYSK